MSVTALPGDPGLAGLALLESNSQSVEEVKIESISSQDGGDFVHWCLEKLTSLDEGIYKFWALFLAESLYCWVFLAVVMGFL